MEGRKDRPGVTAGCKAGISGQGGEQNEPYQGSVIILVGLVIPLEDE